MGEIQFAICCGVWVIVVIVWIINYLLWKKNIIKYAFGSSISDTSIVLADDPVVHCGEIWRNGHIESHYRFERDRSCPRLAKVFCITKDSIIGYCKEHGPKHSYEFSYDQEFEVRHASKREALDCIIVQKIQSS